MKIVGSDIYFDLSKSGPACRGPLNSVWATTQASVYCGIKHIFPDVPINSGCFKPLHLDKPKGTFLYAEYPRPVAGCAAETAQRIMEVVFGAMGQAIPDRVFAAPAGTSGNFSLGGVDPASDRAYVMYIFSGGGYGGYEGSDGLTNGTSPVGISKTQPAEILEQRIQVVYTAARGEQLLRGLPMSNITAKTELMNTFTMSIRIYHLLVRWKDNPANHFMRIDKNIHPCTIH